MLGVFAAWLVVVFAPFASGSGHNPKHSRACENTHHTHIRAAPWPPVPITLPPAHVSATCLQSGASGDACREGHRQAAQAAAEAGPV